MSCGLGTYGTAEGVWMEGGLRMTLTMDGTLTTYRNQMGNTGEVQDWCQDKKWLSVLNRFVFNLLQQRGTRVVDDQGVLLIGIGWRRGRTNRRTDDRRGVVQVVAAIIFGDLSTENQGTTEDGDLTQHLTVSSLPTMTQLPLHVLNMGHQLVNHLSLRTRVFLQDFDLPLGYTEFSLDTVTFLMTMGDMIIQGFNVFIVTGKASFGTIIDRLDLEGHISHLPVDLGNDPGLYVNGSDMVGLNILDLQSTWSTLIKQEASRMTDLGFGLEDLLKNPGDHVGRHMKTLLDGKCLTPSWSAHLRVDKTF